MTERMKGSLDGLAWGTVFVGLGLLVFYMSGCATASKARQDIAKDLNEIVEYQDCPTVCEALKVYIRTRLGVK